jgi:hypothetical protein
MKHTEFHILLHTFYLQFLFFGYHDFLRIFFTTARMNERNLNNCLTLTCFTSVCRPTAGSSGAPTARRTAGRRRGRRRTSSARCRRSTTTSGPCRSSLPRPRPPACTGRAGFAMTAPPKTPLPCPCRTSSHRRIRSSASPPTPGVSSSPRSPGDINVTREKKGRPCPCHQY